jgi:hypothetical protein
VCAEYVLRVADLVGFVGYSAEGPGARRCPCASENRCRRDSLRRRVCVEGSVSIECGVSRECGIVFVDGVEAINALHVSSLEAVVGGVEAERERGPNSMADVERSAVGRSLTRNAQPPEASN